MPSLREVMGKNYMHIAQGTTRVTIPQQAVDYSGGGDCVIFHNEKGEPISAFRCRQSGPNAWAEECDIVDARAIMARALCAVRMEPHLRTGNSVLGHPLNKLKAPPQR